MVGLGRVQVEKLTGSPPLPQSLSPLVNQLAIDKNHKLIEWVRGWGGGRYVPSPPSPFPPQIV